MKTIAPKIDGGLSWGSFNLHCPECDGNYLHHECVAVFFRDAEDSKSGTHVEIDVTGARIDSKADTKNPSGRRDGLTISFYCETCPATSKLNIYQHKGTTYTEWAEV